MTDKLTKDQLKEDALMKQTANAADFMTKHTRLIFGGLVAVVVVAAAVYFVRANSHKAEEKAAGMLAEAAADYDRGNVDAAARRLDDILRDLGGTSAGKQALILYGDVAYARDDFKASADYYERALQKFSGDPIFATAARQGLAAVREEEGRFADAAKLYQDLARNAPNEVIRAEMLFDAARNLLSAGSRDEGLEILERLGRNPSNSSVAADARLRLAEARRNAG